MFGPDPFDLTFATASQLRGSRDAIAARTQGNDPIMRRLVGVATGIFPIVFRQIDALPLAFAPILEIVSSHLQCQFQKHVLNGLEYDLGNAISAGRYVTEIHYAWHGEPCTFVSDVRDQLFGFWQWKTAYAIDLFGNDDLPRLKVCDQPQELRSVGASARGFFAVDAGDVKPGNLGIVDNRLLSLKILFLGTDAEIYPGDAYCHDFLLGSIGYTSQRLAYAPSQKIKGAI